MIPGETILSGAPDVCSECGKKLKFQVCHSAAGYFIGTECNCGPYSRESEYLSDDIEASEFLIRWQRGDHIGART
jgi:hypothetical protein